MVVGIETPQLRIGIEASSSQLLFNFSYFKLSFSVDLFVQLYGCCSHSAF